MKQLLYIGITIIMIFFKTQAHSNYEKVFYDFSIESIDGQIINLSEYKNKNKDVKEFCEVNFNINFPLSSIYEVKGKNAHEIFKWAKDNHGSSAVPKWNFHKILINKSGKVEDTFASFTKPKSNKIINKIEGLLN